MIVFKIRATEGDLTVIPGKLTQLAQSLKDLRPYWADAVTAVREVLSNAMESEGASTRAGSWPALDEKYARWKAKRYPGAKILELTGRLKASLLGGPEQIVTTAPMSVTIESLVPYGGYHQRGEGVKRRAPWSPTDQDASRIVSAMTKQIRRDILSKFAGYHRGV